MGLSASKKVEKTLTDSQEFNAACDSVYGECLDLTQLDFACVRTYQLLDASARLHDRLHLLPIVKRWAPSPPTQAQVDRAVRRTPSREDGLLSRYEFKGFAVEVFKDVIVSSARGAILRRAPIGLAGIAGVGIVTRSRKEAVGKVMGVYVIGVAIAVARFW